MHVMYDIFSLIIIFTTEQLQTIKKQAELGVPHSKSKLSGPNENSEVLEYLRSNKSLVQNEFYFQNLSWAKKI